MTKEQETRRGEIDWSELERKMAAEKPNNDDPKEGWALVNVLGREAFESGHIEHSINIPVGRMSRFEERFDKEKEIVVYCASPECDASPRAAAELEERGFESVQDYAGGLSDWEASGHPVAASSG